MWFQAAHSFLCRPARGRARAGAAWAGGTATPCPRPWEPAPWAPGARRCPPCTGTHWDGWARPTGWPGHANASRRSRARCCLRATAPARPQPQPCRGTPPRGVEPAVCRAAAPGRKPRFPERAFSGSCETGCKKIKPPRRWRRGRAGAERPGWAGGAAATAPHTSHPLTHAHWHSRIPRRTLAPQPATPFPPSSHTHTHARPGPSHARALPRTATAWRGVAQLSITWHSLAWHSMAWLGTLHSQTAAPQLWPLRPRCWRGEGRDPETMHNSSHP